MRRELKIPDDIRVELAMEDALRMYEAKGADIFEICLQPRILQQAGVERNFPLTPIFRFDLTMKGPVFCKPWDLSKRDVRARAKTTSPMTSNRRGNAFERDASAG